MTKIKNFPINNNQSIVTISNKADRCTIGYRRVNRMVQVAVSYCAADDKWKGKTGRDIVIDRLANAKGLGDFGGVISIPANYLDEWELNGMLENMFFGFRPDGE